MTRTRPTPSSAASCFALVTDAFGGRGGIAQYNRDFLDAIAGTGRISRITVLPRLAPDRAVVQAGIRQSPPRFGRAIYTLAALCKAFRQDVDIVFCGHLYMAPLAWFIARLKRAKLIIQTHGIEAWPRPSRLQRASIEAADMVLSVSRYTRAVVLGWTTIAPERVLVLSNTVDERFRPGNGSVLRASLGIEGKRVLITVARMDAGQRYKGHDRVIEAIPTLVSHGHDVIYIVVGEGNDRHRLEERARAAGIADRVRFVGALAADHLTEVFNAADLFVMPSTGEGFGIAFLEAMACGTPAIGLNARGARDALADGTLGSLAPEGDLADEIARILDAPKSEPNTLAEAVQSRFGRAVFIDRVARIFERLLQPA